jgi:hypothetical protein
MIDLSVPEYGVVGMNKVLEATLNMQLNQVSLIIRNKDKFSDNVMMVSAKVMAEMRKFVPNIMKPILSCLDMYSYSNAKTKSFGFLWWRAVSVTFLVRPNAETLKLLDQHSDPVIKNANGKCVSAYVRHGDKGMEMQLVQFQQYADTALCMWASADAGTAVAGAGTAASGHGDKGERIYPACTSFRGYTTPSSLTAPTPPAHRAQPVHSSNKKGWFSKPGKSPARRLSATQTALTSSSSSTPSSTASPSTSSFLPTSSSARAPLSGWKGSTNPTTTNTSSSNSSSSSSSPPSGGGDPKILYLGSEDPLVFQQARQWASAHDVELRCSNLSQVLLSDRQGIMKHRDMESSMPVNRQMEYFSYLLHLHDLLKCSGMICTLGSNYCRLIDELRATVGGKGNTYYADLSPETCVKPPCVRGFSIADYKGPVYDPLDRLW